MTSPGSTVRHYIRKGARFIYTYNRPCVLPYYFSYLIPYNRRSVRIADLGVGLVCTLGTIWGKTRVTVVASDILWPEYKKIWDSFGETPLIPIEQQDMEHLTYPDDSFDVVHCVNALDHTEDARACLREMWRVCKPLGWIYLRHFMDQHRMHRGIHRWDARPDGFFNGKDHIQMSGFTTHSEGTMVVSSIQKEGTCPISPS